MKKTMLLILMFLSLSLVLGCASVTGRTAGEYMDDSTILTEINAKIVKDPDLSFLKINVDVVKGSVTLTGLVPSKDAEQRLIDLSKAIKGVKSVTSNLQVEEKK